MYVGPTGASAVFNVATLTTNTIAGHTNINEFAVVREEKKIEAEIESIMKVRGCVRLRTHSAACQQAGAISGHPADNAAAGTTRAIIRGVAQQACANTPHLPCYSTTPRRAAMTTTCRRRFMNSPSRWLTPCAAA